MYGRSRYMLSIVNSSMFQINGGNRTEKYQISRAINVEDSNQITYNHLQINFILHKYETFIAHATVYL